MFSYQDSEGRIPVLQLNSQLENAQLDLLSAHCAIHQLRLQYSPDDLVRLGRRDILRKSAQAAGAINDFYSSIEKRIAQPSADLSASPPPKQDGTAQDRTSDAQIAEAVQCVSFYLRQQRERYLPAALPLGNQHKGRLQPYFFSKLLDQIRVVELKGERVPPPPFYADARAQGFDNLPEITHMDSLAFVDVVVFNETLTERALFHALVHVVQFQILGVERYTELFVRSFLRTRAHFTVPLEAHAFALTSRFLLPSPERFSVEDHILRWVNDDRY